MKLEQFIPAVVEEAVNKCEAFDTEGLPYCNVKVCARRCTFASFTKTVKVSLNVFAFHFVFALKLSKIVVVLYL